MSKRSVGSVAAMAGLFLFAGSALAIENFIPSGHQYAPGAGPLPNLNSPQDKFNGQVDIYQTEIWTKETDRKRFDSDLMRFLNRDLRPGVSQSPIY
jgi:hypothetical protein